MRKSGDSFILGYTNETDGIYYASKVYPVIIFDDFTTSFHWVDFNFKVKSSAMKILTPKKGINFKYVYYAMKNIRFVPLSHARHWISIYSVFKIPLPPIEVQQEIVNILDKFTELQTELEDELEARKKQYSYYRDYLFNFNNNSAEYFPMGEVGKFIRGNGLQKKNFTESGIGCIHYGQIYTHYGTYANRTKSFVHKTIAQRAKKASKGDIIIADTSENDEDLCKALAWLGDEEIAISNHTFIYKHSLNPKYVAYFLQTEKFQNQKRIYTMGVKVRSISATNISKIIIPVPPLEEQERIVAILDKFDALVSDILIGLPTEIAARRKQYEYYRNKLLTFRELGK